mmetsp:Transcript_70974/g.199136  ORF Transcript_70974/g.199136 Transcript_70974/m.199136 type:complete len:249 (-) Transcript_70974:249-995(-)
MSSLRLVMSMLHTSVMRRWRSCDSRSTLIRSGTSDLGAPPSASWSLLSLFSVDLDLSASFLVPITVKSIRFLAALAAAIAWRSSADPSSSGSKPSAITISPTGAAGAAELAVPSMFPVMSARAEDGAPPPAEASMEAAAPSPPKPPPPPPLAPAAETTAFPPPSITTPSPNGGGAIAPAIPLDTPPGGGGGGISKWRGPRATVASWSPSGGGGVAGLSSSIITTTSSATFSFSIFTPPHEEPSPTSSL